jgi:undecaprenyl diphosphate synthase
MDGNGRWAKERGLARTAGHRRGIRAAKNVAEAALKYGVPYITLYAFSTENFNRPAEEVSHLFKLMAKGLKRYADFFMKNEIRFSAIGDANRLPSELRFAIEDLQKRTANFAKLMVSLAIAYGSRDEIVRATKEIACEKILESKISWETIAEHLYTCKLPDPDMIIRTSGEKRLSNFLLMQAAYAELHFMDVNWPDVCEETFVEILREYAARDRRMGGI